MKIIDFSTVKENQRLEQDIKREGENQRQSRKKIKICEHYFFGNMIEDDWTRKKKDTKYKSTILVQKGKLKHGT